MAGRGVSTAEFGCKLRHLRKKKGLSQAQVAEFVHLSRQSIQAYENGSREPSRQTLISLAELFDIPLGILMRDDVELSKEEVKESIAYGRRKSDDKVLLSLVHEMTPTEYRRFIEYGRNLLQERTKNQSNLPAN